MNKIRFWEIDFARGIAVILMIIFHFIWNLNYFELIEVELYSGGFGLLQKITAGLFLFIAGIILTINYSKHKENYAKNFLLRGAKVFGFGLIITFFSWILFPTQFIYFGVLHLIGMSIVLSIPLIRTKKMAFLLGILLILVPFIVNLEGFGIESLVWMGLSRPFAALDFFPIIPWYGIVLIGISAGNWFYYELKPRIKIEKPKMKIIELIQAIGRKSLIIYFIHQPLLFTIIWLIKVI
ncbi:MAG: heparan-alpha-glucosaminide N-acetyltransferase [Candidatus Diapherotrites archaeon]